MRFKFGVDLDLKKLDPIELKYTEFEEGIINALQTAYKAKEEVLGAEDMRTLERMISLQIIDTKWRDHLYNMDEMRDGIWTLSYGERNPLVEYKIQGFNLFRDMLCDPERRHPRIHDEGAGGAHRRGGDPGSRLRRLSGANFIPRSSSSARRDTRFRRRRPRCTSTLIRRRSHPLSPPGGVKRKKSRRSRRG